MLACQLEAVGHWPRGRLGLMRHAERRDMSWEAEASPVVDDVWPFDPPLSKQGHVQAQSAALAAGAFELVVSSPFRRCVETAMAVCKVAGRASCSGEGKP